MTKTVIVHTVGGNRHETTVEARSTFDVLEKVTQGEFFICNDDDKDICIPIDKIDTVEVLK